MLFPALASVPALVGHYGYFVILPTSMFTGPIIGVIAGLLVSLGTLNWFLTFLALELGDIVGDVAFYFLGRYGHGPVVEPIARWLGATKAGEDKLARAFEKHETNVILINKLNAAGAVVLYYAGAVGMPFGRYLLMNALGSVPKVIFFELIGYFFGQSYLQVREYLNLVGALSLLIPLGLIGAYWYASRVVRPADNDIPGAAA